MSHGWHPLVKKYSTDGEQREFPGCDMANVQISQSLSGSHINIAWKGTEAVGKIIHKNE